MSEPRSCPPPLPISTERDTNFWQVRLPSGQEFGPFTVSQIRQLAREGAIPAAAYLKRVGSQTWRLAATVLVGSLPPQQEQPSSVQPVPRVEASLAQFSSMTSSPPPLPLASPTAEAPQAPSTPASPTVRIDTNKENLLGCLALIGFVLVVFIVYGVIRSFLTDSDLSSTESKAASVLLRDAKVGKVLLAGLAGLGGLGMWMLKEIFSPTPNKQ